MTKTQVAILTFMVDEFEISGRRLRSKLNDRWKGCPWWLRWWEHVGTASFYGNMAWLEDAGLVVGRYCEFEIDGQFAKDRFYKQKEKTR